MTPILDDLMLHVALLSESECQISRYSNQQGKSDNIIGKHDA